MSYLIIDGNSVGYASHNAKVLTIDGQQVQAIYGSLQTLRKLRNDYPDHRILVLWDTKAQWRYDLYPEYKGKRDDTPEKEMSREQYRLQRPMIMQGINLLGVDQLVSEGFEADDIAGFLVRRATKISKRCDLITGDEDWAQLVSAITHWHDPRNGGTKRINRGNFVEKTGVKNASQFLQLKAMQGDTSDTIKGVGGIGEKTGKALIEKWGSIPAMFVDYNSNGEFVPDSFDKESPLRRARKKLNALCEEGSEQRKILKRNLKLMDLRSDRHDKAIGENLTRTKGQQDWDAFIDFCGDLAFASITRNISQWMKLF